MGEAPGVIKDGGILQHMLREVLVSCLVTQMPDMITADISGLNIGDQLTVGELQAPSEVKIITDPDSVIVLVVPPAIEEKPEAEGEEAAAESAGERPRCWGSCAACLPVAQSSHREDDLRPGEPRAELCQYPPQRRFPGGVGYCFH